MYAYPRAYESPSTHEPQRKVLASVGAEGQLRIWDARGQPGPLVGFLSGFYACFVRQRLFASLVCRVSEFGFQGLGLQGFRV